MQMVRSTAAATRSAESLDLWRRAAQRHHLGRIDVVHDQREAVLDEVERHRTAHVAETDESYGFEHAAYATSRH